MSKSSEHIKKFVRSNLKTLVWTVNRALRGGEGLRTLEGHIAAVSPGNRIPAWLGHLRKTGGLGGTDGKSVGSSVETLFAAALRGALPADMAETICVKAARGVDLPGVGIGIKAPSENLCTSEPFTSVYQRLTGHIHDSVVLLTDYQEKKGVLPLRLQVTRCSYFTGSEQADRDLCQIARKWREGLGEDTRTFRKVVRFLAHANRSDPEAKAILSDMRRVGTGRDLRAMIRRMDLWTEERCGGGAHWPSSPEWANILTGRLDGKCGMSDARQWRHRYSLDSLGRI